MDPSSDSSPLSVVAKMSYRQRIMFKLCMIIRSLLISDPVVPLTTLTWIKAIEIKFDGVISTSSEMNTVKTL